MICLSLLTTVHIFFEIKSYGGPVKGEGLRLSIIAESQLSWLANYNPQNRKLQKWTEISLLYGYATIVKQSQFYSFTVLFLKFVKTN